MKAVATAEWLAQSVVNKGVKAVMQETATTTTAHAIRIPLTLAPVVSMSTPLFDAEDLSLRPFQHRCRW